MSQYNHAIQSEAFFIESLQLEGEGNGRFGDQDDVSCFSDLMRSTENCVYPNSSAIFSPRWFAIDAGLSGSHREAPISSARNAQRLPFAVRGTQDMPYDDCMVSGIVD